MITCRRTLLVASRRLLANFQHKCNLTHEGTSGPYNGIGTSCQNFQVAGSRSFHGTTFHESSNDTEKFTKPVEGSWAQYVEDFPRRTFLTALLSITKKDHRLMDREIFLRQQIDEKIDEYMKKYEHLVLDGRSRTHLQMAAAVLSSYRILLPWMGNDSQEVIDIIKQPAGAAASAALTAIQKVAIFLSFNKFGYASKALRNMDDDYGKSFEIEHIVTNESHEARVTRCLYNTVFEAEGAPELTPIFCAMDRMWFSVLDPSRHGVEFNRPTTLAEGGPACRFIVTKVQK